MGNSSSAVSQRLEHASKTGVLSLRELKLEQVPPQIGSLKSSLRTLDVSFNRLSYLPENIGVFATIRTLSSNNNQLVEVPSSLGHLKKLESLHLQCNSLYSLPDSMRRLTSLRTLDLSHNKLSLFPTSLYTLPCLDYLNVSHNSLPALPQEGVEQLAVLELNLSCNSLSSLPVGLSMCRKLKVLRVEENSLELTGLPQELLERSKVSLLCVDGNLFQQRDLQGLPGYQQYMERFTATQRKKD